MTSKWIVVICDRQDLFRQHPHMRTGGAIIFNDAVRSDSEIDFLTLSPNSGERVQIPS